ncbi:DENN domain-containing protein 11-like [Ptychodera flava]|uniref:DENN domain-containing protein 11-like n=1 Tax=Ptychodera flava TaxID=63121 RepID=UPI003969E336
MADINDKAPLLVNIEEEPPIEYNDPREKIKELYMQEAGLAVPVVGTGQNDQDDTINISASNSVCDLTEQDQIVAIFVVAFDTRSGNIIEWCLPEEIDLEGVEFKAMASGSHKIDSDFIYFRKGNFFGLACFENMRVDNIVERGARMKSVGILATSYTLLYRHMQFLESQVRHQLEIPGRYTQLKAFYEDRKGSLPSSLNTDPSSNSSPVINTPATTPGIDELPVPDMKITHPAGCFSQFIKFFGEQIFVLWKYILLQKRILFFSPPPMGVVCYRVYCACLLGQHNVMIQPSGKDIKPHFYVNIADIENLQTELAYVACTTEKIFEEKKDLYDVYVDNQNVTTQYQNLQEMLKVNAADRDKMNKLNTQRSAQQFNMEELGDDSLDDDHVFTTFFLEQNNRLFQTLYDVSLSQDKSLTSDHMKGMGLDPLGDRQFIMDLVELYGIDVVLMVDNPCCPV